MKNAKFSDAQIMAILRQAENGVPVSDLCREQCELLQMARKFGGVDASMMSGRPWRKRTAASTACMLR